MDAFAYICAYCIVKNKKKNMKEIIKNVSIVHVTGRPL
jgi:hypothetical protein